MSQMMNAHKLVASVCCLIGGTALAETRRAGAEQQSEAALETMQVTATRRELSSLDVSSGVTVITAAELAAHTPLTVVEHLQGEPGVYVQQTTPGQGIPIIRGLKGSEVLHLVDGFRVNNAIFRNAPNQYIALIDPWNLERIEAVRGPMSALYGADAMGGVVQFFTRSPSFEGTMVQSRGKVGLQTATGDSSFSTQIEGEIGNDAWVAHGGLTWQDVGELRVGGGERLPFTDFRSIGAHAKVRFEPTEGQTIVVQGQILEQPETPRHDALVPGFGQLQPDSSELLFKPQQRRFVQARWISDDSTPFADSIDLQLGYQRIVDDRTARDFESPNRDLEKNSSTLMGVVGHFTRHVGERHLLSYGFEAYRDSVDSARVRMDIDSSSLSIRPSRFPDGSTMKWAGLYLADEWQTHELLHVTAGIRFSSYKIELTPTINNIGVVLDPQDLSGNLGLAFRASERMRIVANVGRGFRPPNIFDLGTFGPRGDRFSIPNPELEPETVLTYDLGVKYAAESLRAEVMAFQSHYTNKITQVLAGGTDSNGRLIVQSRNATELQFRGIETAAMWQVTSRASLYGTATWVRGQERFETDTYPADRIPPLSGKLVARFVAGSTWTFESSVNWAARQSRLSPRDAVDPRINPDGTAGWATLGLRAAWRPIDELNFSLGVDNLMDRRYREHASGFDAPGRSAFVSVGWEF